MNLFPRRSYFLLAISMGPTSLYPDKPSPKNDPFFWYIEKEPQRPYDQNGGSIAPRSLIFDPIAKEKSKIIANRGIAKKLKSQRLQVKSGGRFSGH